MNDTETEGKLIIVSEEPMMIADRISRLDKIGNYVLGDRLKHKLEDVYFDTERKELSANLISLRIRSVDGQELLTLKGPGEASGLSQTRLEIERDWSVDALQTILAAIQGAGIGVSTRGDLPRGSSAEESLSLLGFGVLASRLTQRTSLTVKKTAGAAAFAELDIDDVLFSAQDTKVRHFEIECELKPSGSPEVVDEVLGELRKMFGCLQPFPFSKLAIGQALTRLSESGRLSGLLSGQVLRPTAYPEIQRVLDSDHGSGAPGF
jgi:inorganic triphosphatase YgiF